jgi:hypothetical protein
MDGKILGHHFILGFRVYWQKTNWQFLFFSRTQKMNLILEGFSISQEFCLYLGFQFVAVNETRFIKIFIFHM